MSDGNVREASVFVGEGGRGGPPALLSQWGMKGCHARQRMVSLWASRLDQTPEIPASGPSMDRTSNILIVFFCPATAMISDDRVLHSTASEAVCLDT